MKKILISFIVLMTMATICVQANTNQPNSSCNHAVYQLFSTDNLWNFIRLNTRNGRMWLVQFSVSGAEHRFQSTLSAVPRVSTEDEANGRFTLVPTKNMWNFILLDQLDGRVWQVQWSTDGQNNLVTPIW